MNAKPSIFTPSVLKTEKISEFLNNASVGLSFEDLPVPLLSLTEDGTILSVNETASNFAGETLKVGNQLSEIMEGLGRPLSDWLSETISGRAIQNSEFLRLKQEDKENLSKWP